MSTEMMFGIGVLVMRFLQILAAALLCVLGYRLFKQIPTSNATAEFSFKEHLKLNVSKVGPGVFFALFGAAILIQALASPIKLERETSTIADVLVPTKERVVIAGQRDTNVADTRGLSSEQLRPQLRFLNRLEGLLRPGLSMEQRVLFENGQREAKLALLVSAWENQWGDFVSFAAWARGERTDTPNPEVRAIWETK